MESRRKIHVPKHQPGVLWAIFARHLGNFEAGCLDQGRPRVRSKGLGFPQLSHVFFRDFTRKNCEKLCSSDKQIGIFRPKKNKDSGIKITLKAAIKRLLFDHPANGIQAPKLGI